MKIMSTDLLGSIFLFARISFTLENEIVMHWCTQSVHQYSAFYFQKRDLG